MQHVPDAVKNEEELNEDTAKRQDATHDDAWHWFGEERLLRNLPWNLICSHWVLNHLQQALEIRIETKHMHKHGRGL